MPKQDLQPSLSAAYKLPGTTPLQNLYLELEARVGVEQELLRKQEYSSRLGYGPIACRLKIMHLDEKLYQLRRVLFIKENMQDYHHLLLKNKKEADVDLHALNEQAFESIDDLLDYKVSYWNVDKAKPAGGAFLSAPSLREALNISRTLTALFRSPQTFFMPLWGKTKSLEHFEESLKNEVFDSDAYKKHKQSVVSDEKNPLQILRDYQKQLLAPKFSPIATREPYTKNGPG